MDVTEFNKKALISLDESFSARPGGAKTAKFREKEAEDGSPARRSPFYFSPLYSRECLMEFREDVENFQSIFPRYRAHDDHVIGECAENVPFAYNKWVLS